MNSCHVKINADGVLQVSYLYATLKPFAVCRWIDQYSYINNVKACHWTKKAPEQTALSGIIGIILMCFLLQKQSFWHRYTPICVTRQISRNSTMVRSTWLPIPKTHTKIFSPLCIQKCVSVRAHWFICVVTSQQRLKKKDRAAPLLTSHALFFLIKTKSHPSEIFCVKFQSHWKGFFFYLNLFFFSYCISVCSFDLCVTSCDISQRAARRRLHTLRLEHW